MNAKEQCISQRCWAGMQPFGSTIAMPADTCSNEDCCAQSVLSAVCYHCCCPHLLACSEVLYGMAAPVGRRRLQHLLLSLCHLAVAAALVAIAQLGTSCGQEGRLMSG
jgi:hypothetical protein